MNNRLKLFFSLLLSGLFVSCNSSQIIPQKNNSAKILNNESLIKFKLLKPELIDKELKEETKKTAQNYSDETSKRRKIEKFDIPSNPIGMEIKAKNDTLSVLSFIGTAKKRNDLNVEIRAFKNKNQEFLTLNYSGPITQSNILNNNKPENNFKKLSSNEFEFELELIYGLPPESIIKTYEKYFKNLEKILTRVYRPKEIIFGEDVFIFAVKYNNELKGFYFDIHRNQLILGERKYADLQTGLFIGTDREAKLGYTIVAFNPKTDNKINPKYKYVFSDEQFEIVELGEL